MSALATTEGKPELIWLKQTCAYSRYTVIHRLSKADPFCTGENRAGGPKGLALSSLPPSDLDDPALRGPTLGEVTAVDGSQARLRLRADGADTGAARLAVGRHIAIDTGTTLAIGLVTRMTAESERSATGIIPVAAHLDLIGEIRPNHPDGARFRRGVTEYPVIGDPAAALRAPALRLMFDSAGDDSIEIGHLQQDASIPAAINVKEMLSKHFAILGTTGVGKSSGVALMLREVLAKHNSLKVFLLDPHNEYGRCFGTKAQVLSPHNLKLPFWLFNFEEIVDVFFRGRPGIEEETSVLQEIIPLARAKYLGVADDRSSLRRGPKGAGFTVDTPVPYRLSDLVGLLDERLGRLENRSHATIYNRLIMRIERLRGDPRYDFMFESANVGGDTMVDVIRDLFRLDTPGSAMTVMQLAGFPPEVVDSVVSVLGRLAFEFGVWSDGAIPLLFMCEESHRYAPADRSIGFGPTRKAISRIAKEGRKYGVFLGLVTQRPAELDPTIVSQCSTIFAMRMANDKDQAIVRSAVSDAGASFLAFVPSLGTREVFAFGEGVAVPTRLRFKALPEHLLPRGEAITNARLDADRGIDRDFIGAVVERWRKASMSSRGSRLDEFAEFEAPASAPDPAPVVVRRHEGPDVPIFRRPDAPPNPRALGEGVGRGNDPVAKPPFRADRR